MDISNLSRAELENIIIEHLHRHFGKENIVISETGILQESYLIGMSEIDDTIINQLNPHIYNYEEVAVHSGEVAISDDNYFVSMITNVDNTALIALILTNTTTDEAQLLQDFL